MRVLEEQEQEPEVSWVPAKAKGQVPERVQEQERVQEPEGSRRQAE